MDSLEIDGKAYISARRAAKEHGYVADYIGQLIRAGKLVGKKVGRAWYVDVESLDAYIRTSYTESSQFGTSAAESAAGLPAEAAPTPQQPELAKTDLQEEAEAETAVAAAPDTRERSTYELLRYIPEEEPPLPKLSEASEESAIVIRALHTRAEVPAEPLRHAQLPQERSAGSGPFATEDAFYEELEAAESTPGDGRGGAHVALRTASFVLSVLIAALGLAIGAASIIAVRNVEFSGSSVSASIASLQELYLEKAR